MGIVKFDKKKCVSYVQSIEDFIIEYAGTDYLGNNISHIEKESSKTYLTKFLIECEGNSEESRHKFLLWLDKQKQHWRLERIKVISELNEHIKRQDGKKKKESKSQQSKYIDFFYHIEVLIKMIADDVINDFQNVSVLPHTKTKPTYLQYALYYYYLQSAGEKEWFDNFKGGKVKAIENAIKETGLVSAKRFQLCYNEICIKATERALRCKKKDYQTLQLLLSRYPKAKAIAKQELEKTNW